MLLAIISAAPALASTAMDAQSRTSYRQATQRGLTSGGMLLHVSVTHQKLHVVDSSGIRYRYTVSTSKFGTGSRENSNRTPLGWHEVADRIGGDAVPGQVFVARAAVSGRVLPVADWRQTEGQDLVLTRIMRLRGSEPGSNSGTGIDSYDRFIYIHGTNQEQMLGRPASHGCIRMGNRAVIALYRMLHGREAWCCIMERFPR